MKTDGETCPAVSELHGRLIRVVNIDDLKSYLAHRSDTGHIVFTVQGIDKSEEHHVLIINGKPVATCSGPRFETSPESIEALYGKKGVIEYYFKEERDIRAILDKYCPSAALKDKMPLEPATVSEEVAQKRPIMLPEKDRFQAYAVEEPYSAMTPGNSATELSSPHAAMLREENYSDIVKKVEDDFTNNIDALLERLDLSHLKKQHDRVKK